VSKSIHYTQRLTFRLAQDFSDFLRLSVAREVDKIAGSRKWSLNHPVPLDEVVESELGTPTRIVGGFLDVRAADPPSALPISVDQAHLDEVSYLVECLRKFSEEYGLAFEFELDGTFVGSVEDGKIDRTLQVGLLDEWRRVLQSRTRNPAVPSNHSDP